MNTLTVRQTYRKYVLYGILAILFIGTAQLFSLNARLSEWFSPFIWQVVTGSILLGIILFQWLLFYFKWNRITLSVRSQSRIHHWSGLIAVLVLALHAQSVGYHLTFVVFIIFVAIAISGLLNEKFIKYSNRSIRKAMLWGHIALAAAMMPLILLHAVVALSFE